jgi:hypothetical protein
MESGRSTKVNSEHEKEGEEPHPFRYSRTFEVGRRRSQEQAEAIMGDDQELVSSFVDELLRSSAAGREFAKNSLSIRNATRSPGEKVSTDM